MSKKIKIYGLVYNEDAIKRAAKKNQYFNDNEMLVEKYHDDSEHIHVFEYVFPDEVKIVFDGDDIKAYIGKNLIGYVSKDGREELEAYMERNNTNNVPLVFQYGKHKIVCPNKEVLDFGEERDAWVLLDGVEDITAMKEANTSEEKISVEDRSPFDVVDNKKGSRKAGKKTKKKKPFYKKWWFWLIVGLVLIGALSSGGDSESNETAQAAQKVEESAKTTEKAKETAKTKETAKAKETEKASSDNGVDPNEWPELAKSGLSKQDIIGIYNDYEKAFETYPEDSAEAEAYDKKVAEDAAKKYNTTPELADSAYGYASLNYDKLVGTGNNDYKLLFGELQDVKVNGSTIMIKAKITSSLTDKGTVKKNYHSVCDLITKQGLDKYDEIQYWAVADMTDGSESKVISFTVPKETIEAVKNEKIVATQLEDHIEDLWIHPSLKS